MEFAGNRRRARNEDASAAKNLRRMRRRGPRIDTELRGCGKRKIAADGDGRDAELSIAAHGRLSPCGEHKVARHENAKRFGRQFRVQRVTAVLKRTVQAKSLGERINLGSKLGKDGIRLQRQRAGDDKSVRSDLLARRNRHRIADRRHAGRRPARRILPLRAVRPRKALGRQRRRVVEDGDDAVRTIHRQRQHGVRQRRALTREIDQPRDEGASVLWRRRHAHFLALGHPDRLGTDRAAGRLLNRQQMLNRTVCPRNGRFRPGGGRHLAARPFACDAVDGIARNRLP